MNKMQNYLEEVEQRLLSFLKRQTVSSYESMQRIVIPVPVVRKEVKTKFSFTGVSHDEKIEIWDYIWNNTQYYEVMSLSLYNYQHKSLSEYEIDFILNWVNRCSCWEHSDDLSKIYAHAFEENTALLLPYYKKWNRSENLWKRRQSVVGLVEYASKRKKAPSFETMIQFVEPLLSDPEYYVQKGVGWTLREMYNLYPEITAYYIEKNICHISPDAYGAASEKVSKELKIHWNMVRKRNRKGE